MIDKFCYKFFGGIDKLLSFVETYSVKFTSWLWEKRAILVRKKRRVQKNK
jgi:hypothetical protein